MPSFLPEIAKLPPGPDSKQGTGKTHLLPYYVPTGNHFRQSLLGTKLGARLSLEHGERGSRQLLPKTEENGSVLHLLTKLHWTHPQSSINLPQTAPSQNSLKLSRSSSSITKLPSPSTLRVDLSNKLGRDGKLNSNERKCRINNNLCLYCRSKDHKINGCPRKQLIRTQLTTLEKQETPLSENLSKN